MSWGDYEVLWWEWRVLGHGYLCWSSPGWSLAFVQMSPEVWLVTLHFTPLSPDQGDCLYLPFNTFALWQMSWPSTWFLSIGQKRTSEFLFHPTEANGGAECYDTDSLSASSCHAIPPFLFCGCPCWYGWEGGQRFHWAVLGCSLWRLLATCHLYRAASCLLAHWPRQWNCPTFVRHRSPERGLT